MTTDTLAKLAEFNRYFTSANSADVGQRVSIPTTEWRALHAAITAQALPAAEPVGFTFSPMWLAPLDGSPVMLYLPTTTDKFAVGIWHDGHGGGWGDDEGNYYTHEPVAFCSLANLERFTIRPTPQAAQQAAQATAGWVLVPVEPTEDQWGGLARDILMAFDMGSKTPAKLLDHLEKVGREIPQWLRDEGEMKDVDHVISKGTRAVIIYRAMLAALPQPPQPQEDAP